MSDSKRTILITGCSDGGLGAALAVAFHEAGLHVYATARNPSKMTHLASLGIETLILDVLSDSSIAACVETITKSNGSLDILLNNAGALYNMPVTDVSIPEAKKLFDLNVWSYIAMAQAFMPLLLKSPKGMIVNQTSVTSIQALPFQSAYCASKAAMSMFSNLQRLELEGFGITVVELKTGLVKSNLIKHQEQATQVSLPEDSIFWPAKEAVERVMRQDEFATSGMDSQEWAKLVCQDLLKCKPPPVIWRGESAGLARFASAFPFGMFDGTTKKMGGLDVVERLLRK
ncbi:NAD(P)-binding protein [Acephala macrosclerotiorum]|nr:NAD(P)-binding protein [Acephala macrosclerotiorum]